MRFAWTIAGSDPSGVAGSQIDQRTFAALGVEAASIISAVTAQNFTQWHSATPVSHECLKAQLDALTSPLMPKPAAVKIGMLGTTDAVSTVGKYLADLSSFIVLDPLISSSSGGQLNNPSTTQAMIQELLPVVDLLTPNIPEAEALIGQSIGGPLDFPAAAAKLRKLGVKRVLIKGGHERAGDYVHDYYQDENSGYWLTTLRLTHGARGTGCALASAIAAYVALGLTVEDSLIAARCFINRGIRTARKIADNVSLLGWDDLTATDSDMPWRTANLEDAKDRPSFPSCGPRPLGFYPVVDSFAWVKRLAKHGATTIQLRIKDRSPAEITKEIAEAVSFSRNANIRLFINDYWQLAIELGAYGVHLGQEDLWTADLRAIARAGLRLGISTHCYSEAAIAHSIRPSYVALGPIFETTCMSLRFGPHGMGRISEWRRLLPYPLVAIGGLKAKHAEHAMQLGADGVAVISDVVHSDDPDTMTRLWLTKCGQDLL
jgi:hydroxymethylpyrimidine kinase/phosphomethylpyrimidine kinase/thiamine-phosphate diphosphorylase